ncbi:MAG: hypothetical protein WC365_07575, partial [Candidatus Babeliales bacterium]
ITDTTQATANVTVTLSCSFSGQCASEGKRCSSCANNPANYKQDYYVSAPCNPWNPWPTIWCDDGSATFHMQGSTITITGNANDHYKQLQSTS